MNSGDLLRAGANCNQNCNHTASQHAPAARQLPKWEAEARDRVRTAVRRFARPLTDLIARDANEGDTRLLVTPSTRASSG
jgi:hypothetical protein